MSEPTPIGWHAGWGRMYAHRDPAELERGCVIAYDPDDQTLNSTEWIGPNEYGATEIIATNVRRATGDAICEALDAARRVSEWHDSIGSGPIEELNAELGELHRLIRAIR